MGGHPLIGERHEHRFQGLGSLLVRVEPPGKASRVQDDGHPVVNQADDTVGVGRDERARLDPLLALLAQLPEAGKGEGAPVLELEVIRRFATRPATVLCGHFRDQLADFIWEEG
jgi:hypothetical protein